jgi:hypothetical protein
MEKLKPLKKTGYSPACKNDGVYGIGQKVKAKCKDCKKRKLHPIAKKFLSQPLPTTMRKNSEIRFTVFDSIVIEQTDAISFRYI